MTDELVEAKETYRQIHRENIARFSVTPIRKFRKRAKRYEACRESYASLVGVGDTAVMPPKSTQNFKNTIRRTWHNGLDEFTAFLLMISIPIGVIAALIIFIDGPYDPKDHPLPRGIVQNGSNFVVSADYLRGAKADELDPEYDLCHRLPGGATAWELKSTKMTETGEMRVACAHDD